MGKRRIIWGSVGTILFVITLPSTIADLSSGVDTWLGWLQMVDPIDLVLLGIGGFLVASAVNPELPGKILATLGNPAPTPPVTQTWIHEDEALEIVRESAPVLRIIASWNRPDDWHSLIGTTRRLVKRRGRGDSDQERLQQREQHDAVVYYFQKVIEKYPAAKKKTKYSKEIFVWALRRIGMEERNI